MRPVSWLPLLSLLLVQQAVAEPKPFAPANRRMLSQAELRTCILQEEDLHKRYAALRNAQAAHSEASAKLSAEAMQLSAMLRSIDETDEAAVNQYNKLNEARNADVEVHNRRAAALNATVDELRATEADYIASCVSRPFLQRDETAVLKELGLKKRRAQREQVVPRVTPRPTQGREA